jgi:hypothetical protein
MRLLTIRAGTLATAAAVALAACSGHGVIPSSSSALAPTALGGDLSPLKKKHKVKTCATSPPQYEWIFKGACEEFSLKPDGSSFSLPEYSYISIKGSIGKNTVKGSATIALADAVDKDGDIEEDKGKAFPPYKANGTTIVYASAVNQTTQTIKPISVKGKPVLQYVITDTKGLPGNTCGAAVLAEQRDGKLAWTSLPATGTIKGDSVTISQYEVPQGFELPPKAPLYFGVNCYKS